ncbi:LytTR family DNA-binding domain-containing protein [Lysobacter niabensis]|uniref:LytTR family DNA-binding domain-containing protein n=1 Tax=Agrilutibacter niabensis TaxID=380628 RepID=UPI003611070A
MDSPTPPPASSATAPDNLWDRYQPWRHTVEWGFWIVSYLAGAIANSVTVLMDVRRLHLDFESWEPAVWEWSSHLVSLALIPAVLWFTRRFPMHFDTWRRNLRWLALGSVAWSALHVAGMVGLRKLVYSVQGYQYDFSPWLTEFFYEYLKDVRHFAGLVVLIELYRLLVRRLQGEASLLAVPDDVPLQEQPERPERFLVRKLGKEFLVAAADVEWLQASGNYVNLHVRGRDYPLRTTMAAIEEQLDPSRFVRVHRSYIVNLDCVGEIEPLDTGDARIAMRDGAIIPCSRTYRDALRPERRAA